MTGFALKGLASRKLRTLLTTIAIVLGVAMVSGTYVLTDTIEKAFDQIFAGSYEDTDGVLSGVERVDWSESGRATVPEELLAQVRGLPEVAEASGTVLDLSGDSDQAQILDRSGEPIQNGNPTFGFGIAPEAERFNPFELTTGRWASGPDEVAIDVETAATYGYGVGDTIGVVAQGPVERFRVVGILRLGDVDTIGGATIALFDVPTAQALLAKDGFDAIAVAAKEGVSERDLLAALGRVAPSNVEVRTGAEHASKESEGIDEFISFIRYFLLAFGGIALLVGGFVIFNTLSITVAQRTRELATLRTLGASRHQVLRSVVLEGLVIGLVASVLGIAVGVALAQGLSAVFGALDLKLPQADTVFRTRTAIVPLVLGVGITLFASLVPAVRATRVPAIAAVREGANLASARLSRKVTAVALVLASSAGAAVVYGVLGGGVSAGQRLLMLVLGIVGVFVGVAMLAPRLVRPLAAVLGRPSALVAGSAGRLARENAVRNPGRTAATAAALMIGVTLATFAAVLASGLLESGEKAVLDQVRTGYVVTSKESWESIPVAAGEAVGRAEGVELASSVRYDRAHIAGVGAVDVSGVDPATIADAYRFQWSAGSDAAARSLGRDGALVQRSFAEDEGVSVGDELSLVTPSGAGITVVVRGVFDPPELDSLLGQVVVSHAAFDASFERPSDAYALVDATSGSTLERAVAAYPAADVLSPAEFAESRHSDLNAILNLLYVLLALAVLVSLFGMVNTLVLAVFERTRELGMLRAVGMTRRQARRMIRHEGVITALIGAGIGIPLGIGLAALVIQSLREYAVEFSLPVGTLVVFTIVTVLAGTAAAILPARRASRLNVLEALQYE
jgi:putative ABC transport system permease protein